MYFLCCLPDKYKKISLSEAETDLRLFVFNRNGYFFTKFVFAFFVDFFIG